MGNVSQMYYSTNKNFLFLLPMKNEKMISHECNSEDSFLLLMEKEVFTRLFYTNGLYLFTSGRVFLHDPKCKCMYRLKYC